MKKLSLSIEAKYLLNTKNEMFFNERIHGEQRIINQIWFSVKVTDSDRYICSRARSRSQQKGSH